MLVESVTHSLFDLARADRGRHSGIAVNPDSIFPLARKRIKT